MVEQVRTIEPKIQDIFAELIGAYVLPLTISEENITMFCKPCDNYIEGKPCKIVGQNDQARYAARKGCGWASKDGVRGSMSINGFIASD